MTELTPSPSQAPGTGAAGPVALPPPEEHNAQALAVFYNLEGAENLGYVLVGRQNNKTRLPTQNTIVQLTGPSPMKVRIGHRIRELTYEKSRAKLSDHEREILTIKGIPIDENGRLARIPHEERFRRNADALRVVFEHRGWKALGYITEGGLNEDTGLPKQVTKVTLTGQRYPKPVTVAIGQRVFGLKMSDSQDAQVSPQEEEVLKEQGFIIEGKKLIISGVSGRSARLPVPPSADTWYARRTVAPAVVPEQMPTGFQRQPGMTVASSYRRSYHRETLNLTYENARRYKDEETTSLPPISEVTPRYCQEPSRPHGEDNTRQIIGQVPLPHIYEVLGERELSAPGLLRNASGGGPQETQESYRNGMPAGQPGLAQAAGAHPVNQPLAPARNAPIELPPPRGHRPAPVSRSKRM
ncbi:hypothetical protein ACH4C6_34440 [Streptomyces sp. NPDC017943]|uniref:hypothetical protein n=1 Tax=Streptomyces sp. NPDC017943 TaxID=3365019 RepID=UPI0037ACE480